MKVRSISWAGAALLFCVAPITAALAQPVWVPGSEITGQPVQVTTNGVTDTVVFGPGGQATITTPGGRVVPASWTAVGGNLCLSANGGQECWPYASPFQAGQQLSRTSTCGSTDTFFVTAINAPPPPPPAAAPERG